MTQSNPTAIVRNKKTYRRVSEYISSDGEVGYYNHDTKTFQVRGETTKTNFETEEKKNFVEELSHVYRTCESKLYNKSSLTDEEQFELLSSCKNKYDSTACIRFIELRTGKTPTVSFNIECKPVLTLDIFKTLNERTKETTERFCNSIKNVSDETDETDAIDAEQYYIGYDFGFQPFALKLQEMVDKICDENCLSDNKLSTLKVNLINFIQNNRESLSIYGACKISPKESYRNAIKGCQDPIYAPALTQFLNFYISSPYYSDEEIENLFRAVQSKKTPDRFDECKIIFNEMFRREQLKND